jgi:poly(glycerol-phosphate) alpha-glucosyltransferase
VKVAQLSFSLSNRAGGIFEIQLGLCSALQMLGVDVYALGLQDDLSQRDFARWQGIPAKCLPVFGPKFFGFAREFGKSIEDFQPDICHLQTLWMYPSVALLNWHKKFKKPYLVTPNGMLEPWALANSGWKKRLAGFFYEKRMLTSAACLQANTLKEADDFRAYGLRNRIEIIPNGVDLPDIGKAEHLRDSAEPKGKINVWPREGNRSEAELSRNAEKLKGWRRRLLFLGRIHPKKGLVGLLRAWARLKRESARWGEWELVVAGWDQGGHEGELKGLCAEFGLRIADGGVRRSEALDARHSTLDSNDVLFYGPAFGEEKEALLRSAEGFVLPSLSEGLPMSVLEAWAYGLPVVMTPECNLPDGFACQAALEIRNGEEQNSKSGRRKAENWDGLRGFLEMGERGRREMGMRGRRLVEERFTWTKVAARMREIYESLL